MTADKPRIPSVIVYNMNSPHDNVLLCCIETLIAIAKSEPFKGLHFCDSQTCFATLFTAQIVHIRARGKSC